MRTLDHAGPPAMALVARAEAELSAVVNLCLRRGLPREMIGFLAVHYPGFHFADPLEQRAALAFILDQPAWLLATDGDMEWIVASLLEFGTSLLEEVGNVRPS